YWRPSGKNINRGKGSTDNDDWGVRPDKGQEVIVEGDALRRLALARLHRDVFKPPTNGASPTKPAETQPLADPQLDRAIREVEGRLRGAGGS
ncbi:MAG: hypothetical protein NTW96_26520, partial [Planctomycetia bacterium]|nr:hypothetical protein [Planctomycetia bacterium]